MAEIEAEGTKSRIEVAEYLREFADKLALGEKVTITYGNESATINPPDTVEFEVEVDSATSLMGTDPERSVAFEIEWVASEEPEDDELDVQ